jgi:hypothetical protein
VQSPPLACRPRRVEGKATSETASYASRETPKASAASNAQQAGGGAERSEKALGRTSDMHAFGESDGPIVPKKQANQAGASAAEPVEGRGPTQGNDLPAGHVPDSEPGQRGRGLQGVREAISSRISG